MQINNLMNTFKPDLSVDNLLGQLESLTVTDKNINSDAIPSNMSQANQINWNLFKSKVENIKPFDGDSTTLNKFITACENLISTYTSLNDDIVNKHVFECIQGTLIGKAETMVGNRVMGQIKRCVGTVFRRSQRFRLCSSRIDAH